MTGTVLSWVCTLIHGFMFVVETNTATTYSYDDVCFFVVILIDSVLQSTK